MQIQKGKLRSNHLYMNVTGFLCESLLFSPRLTTEEKIKGMRLPCL